MFKLDNKLELRKLKKINSEIYVLNDIRRMPVLVINGTAMKDIEAKFLNRIESDCNNNQSFLAFILDSIFENSGCSEFDRIFLEIFLSKYLHQAGIYYQNVKFISNKLLSNGYIVTDDGINYQFFIKIEGNLLIIDEECKITKYYKIEDTLSPVTPKEKDNFFIYGKAKYHLFIKDWIVHYKIDIATIECNEEKFRSIFSKKSLLDKLLHFFTNIITDSFDEKFEIKPTEEPSASPTFRL